MPPANRAGDQFDTLVVIRHKPVLEDSLKPSRLCRVSGRNGGQFTLAHGGVSAPEPRGSSGLIARPRAHARARTPHAPAPPDRWVEELTGEARCLDARASNVERVPT